MLLELMCDASDNLINDLAAFLYITVSAQTPVAIAPAVGEPCPFATENCPFFAPFLGRDCGQPLLGRQGARTRPLGADPDHQSQGRGPVAFAQLHCAAPRPVTFVASLG